MSRIAPRLRQFRAAAATAATTATAAVAANAAAATTTANAAAGGGAAAVAAAVAALAWGFSRRHSSAGPKPLLGSFRGGRFLQGASA